jgi:hypothetical protein
VSGASFGQLAHLLGCEVDRSWRNGRH